MRLEVVSIYDAWQTETDKRGDRWCPSVHLLVDTSIISRQKARKKRDTSDKMKILALEIYPDNEEIPFKWHQIFTEISRFSFFLDLVAQSFGSHTLSETWQLRCIPWFACRFACIYAFVLHPLKIRAVVNDNREFQTTWWKCKSKNVSTECFENTSSFTTLTYYNFNHTFPQRKQRQFKIA